MAKRGRKSADERATRPVVAFTRRLPEPPAGLTAPEAETWRSVIGSPAGSMIGPEAHPLLIEFCRQVAMSDVLAEQVHAFEPEWLTVDGGLERLDRLLKMQDRVVGKIASLSVKLRLAPSTRVRRETAGRIVDDQSRKTGRRLPWDTD